MEYYDGSNKNTMNNNSPNNTPIEEYEGYETRGRGKDYKLLEELRIALSVPSRLKEMMDVSKKSFIKYVAFISILAAVIIYLIPFVANIAGFGGFKSLFNEKMPAFKYEGGRLTAEKKFDMMISGYHIYIDTSQESVSSSTLPSNGIYLAFGSKKVTFNYVDKTAVNDFSTVIYSADLNTILMEGMDNSTFANASISFYISGLIITLFMTLIVVVKYLLLALIYTGLMLIPYKLFAKNIYMDEAFKVSYYAQTIGILIVSINKSLGMLLPELLVSVVGVFLTLRFIKYTLSYKPDNEE